MNKNRIEKFIVDSCSLSLCQIVQDQNVNINSIDVIIQEYFPSVECLGCPTSCTEMNTISSYVSSGAELGKFLVLRYLVSDKP